MLNHIATGMPGGIAKKEFIKNLAGNFITINNETGEVSGTAPSTDGYKGSDKVAVIPTSIAADADNGITYDIEDWFSFTSNSLFLKIQQSFPAFHQLIRDAGLSDDLFYRYNFISDNEFYTVFAPTQEAINNSGADTLSVEELKKFVLMHFVQGDFIFTDGNKPPGYYETARIDEKSTQFSIVNTGIYIEPGIDVITINDKDGNEYLTIDESPMTNLLTGRNIGESTAVFLNVVNTAVLHGIDKALLFEEVDTR